MYFKFIFAIAVSATLSMFCVNTFAAEMPWKTRNVQYVAERKELKAFLREFAASQDVGIFIDEQVQGALTGRYDLTPRSMMALLASTFGLTWYFDGRVLHVYPSTAMDSEVVKLEDTTQAEFERTLQRLGISDSRFPLSYDADTQSALVSGPRRFVELVKQAARSGGRPASQESPMQMRVFPLRFALADDYVYQQGGREYRVAGVVTMLRQLYAEKPSTQLASVKRPNATIKPPVERTTKLTGTDVTVRLPPSFQDFQRATAEALDPPTTRSQASSSSPTFAADTRTNTVIIRDAPERLSSYESVIKALDVRPQIIEIDATIIEVSSDDFSSLGIDWRVLSNRVDAQVGGGNRQPPSSGLAASGTPDAQASSLLGSVSGGVLSAVIGDRRKLIARISALEEKGRASVRAQPKVITLNNVEAVLESLSTFYVRVAGFQDAQLFDISVGTSIRVTPSVIAEQLDQNQVRLLLRIEDGALSEQKVDQIPVVQRTTLAAQSLVAEGQTLVIAGYSQEREREAQTGLPVFSSLPVIGALFRTTEKSRARVERLFIITPRLLPHVVGQQVTG